MVTSQSSIFSVMHCSAFMLMPKEEAPDVDRMEVAFPKKQKGSKDIPLALTVTTPPPEDGEDAPLSRGGSSTSLPSAGQQDTKLAPFVHRFDDDELRPARFGDELDM